MDRRRRWFGGVLAGALCASVCVAAPAEAPNRNPPAPAPATKPDPRTLPSQSVLHFLPKARQLSTYTLSARFETETKNVTFEAPPAYKAGFDFWSGRMKNQKRSEVFEMKTDTQEADAGGVVPFRRTIPKFDLEVEKQGQILVGSPGVEKSLATVVFEGTFDPLGNVKEFRKTAGDEDPEIDGLAIPEVSRVFPEIDGPHDLRIGEGFKEERIVRLPTKLGIAGLETVTLKVTREYVLKSMEGGLATFDVKTTYTDDPAFKPGAERTTCHVSGGGGGDAVFEIGRGVFQRSRLTTSMHIDIEAPLRALPDHPETEQPGVGKSHIDLALLLSGQQTVRRVWGEEKD